MDFLDILAEFLGLRVASPAAALDEWSEVDELLAKCPLNWGCVPREKQLEAKEKIRDWYAKNRNAPCNAENQVLIERANIDITFVGHNADVLNNDPQILQFKRQLDECLDRIRAMLVAKARARKRGYYTIYGMLALFIVFLATLTKGGRIKFEPAIETPLGKIIYDPPKFGPKKPPDKNSLSNVIEFSQPKPIVIKGEKTSIHLLPESLEQVLPKPLKKVVPKNPTPLLPPKPVVPKNPRPLLPPKPVVPEPIIIPEPIKPALPPLLLSDNPWFSSGEKILKTFIQNPLKFF